MDDVIGEKRHLMTSLMLFEPVWCVESCAMSYRRCNRLGDVAEQFGKYS